MKASIIIAVLSLVLAGCSASFFGTTWSQKSTPIDRLAIGDSMDQVQQKLGAPAYASPGQITEDGHLRVEWHYGVIVESKRSTTAAIEPLAGEPLSVQKQIDQQRGDDREYVVVFQDGRVLNIGEKPAFNPPWH